VRGGGKEGESTGGKMGVPEREVAGAINACTWHCGAICSV